MKINLGSSKLKSSYFPKSFDSSTTCNFGEFIPQFCDEQVTDAHVSASMRSGVRFSPLTLPTFGKAFLHHYAYYHKFCDLWKPYNDFLARTPYTSFSGNTYIPTTVPNIPIGLLWTICCCHSNWSIWEVGPGGTIFNPGEGPLNVGRFTFSKFDLPDTPSQLRESLNNGLVYTLFTKVFSSGSPYSSYLRSTLRNSNLVYPLYSPPSVFTDGTASDLASSEVPLVYPAGSDYMIQIKISELYYQDLVTKEFKQLFPQSASGNFVLCFKLNNSGKFLRKIFMGLGYHLKSINKAVNALPLFAYFKSYFSTFAPKRFVKYEQTYFSRLMTYIESNGLSMVSALCSDAPGLQSTFLSEIIDELLSCYYTEDTDYYSSQIIGNANDYGDELSQSYLAQNGDDSIQRQVLASDVSAGLTPSINFASGVTHTQSQQNILQRLTTMVNRRSLVGGKIADFLQSVFGITPNEILDDSNPYLGSSVIDVDFSDVFSTAETQEASLGEYAGKALGIGNSDQLSCKCTSPGLFIVASVVVPRTQKVQGINPNLFHIIPSDFYNPQFDGLTLLPTDRLSLYCIDSLVDQFTNQSFGNQSLFAEYKTRTQGILNGDLSLMSVKSSFDSFTMDQVISDYVSQDENSDGTLSVVVTAPNLSNIAAGTMWRYIGRWLWLGNFDRIFVNQRQFYSTDYYDYSNVTWQSRDTHVIDDNLILHNIVDLKINAPMLPLADSYMTKDLEDLQNGVGVRSQSE